MRYLDQNIPLESALESSWTLGDGRLVSPCSGFALGGCVAQSARFSLSQSTAVGVVDKCCWGNAAEWGWRGGGGEMLLCSVMDWGGRIPLGRAVGGRCCVCPQDGPCSFLMQWQPQIAAFCHPLNPSICGRILIRERFLLLVYLVRHSIVFHMEVLYDGKNKS